VYHGRFSPEKHLDLLLHAAKGLAGNLPEAPTVLLIGDGSERGRLAALARQLRVRVEWVPWTSHPLDHFDSKDIYVLPSVTETHSVSVIEAISKGCRVVARAVGASPSYAEHYQALTVFESDGQLQPVLSSVLRQPSAAGSGNAVCCPYERFAAILADAIRGMVAGE